MNKIFLTLLLCAGFSGCSHSTFYVNPNRVVYPPVSPADVAVSPQKRISTPHKQIGRVAVLDSGDGEQAIERLRATAAQIGGNLVIDLRVEKTLGGVAASGLAVLLYQR